MRFPPLRLGAPVTNDKHNTNNKSFTTRQIRIQHDVKALFWENQLGLPQWHHALQPRQ